MLQRLYFGCCFFPREKSPVDPQVSVKVYLALCFIIINIEENNHNNKHPFSPAPLSKRPLHNLCYVVPPTTTRTGVDKLASSSWGLIIVLLLVTFSPPGLSLPQSCPFHKYLRIFTTLVMQFQQPLMCVETVCKYPFKQHNCTRVLVFVLQVQRVTLEGSNYVCFPLQP